MIEGLQQANISLNKGIVRTPSLGQEGELSECVNLIPHAGEIVRIKEPQQLMGLELLEDEILLATNRCEGAENLIVRNGSSLAYYRSVGEQYDRFEIDDFAGEDIGVVTLGQTLVVSQGGTKRYYMWQEGAYTEQNLSSVTPRVEMLLGDIRPHFTNADAFASTSTKSDVKILVGESGYYTQDFPKGTSASRVLYRFGINPGENGKYHDTDDIIEWAQFFGVSNNPNDGEAYEMDSEVLTNLIRGAYNQVREKMRDRGLACFPFYVRWGVRLYDGSVINLSSPILMTPSSVIRPKIGLYRPKNVVQAEALNGDLTYPTGATWSFTPLFAARYLYAAVDASALEGIDDKLIEGVVVYATPEIEVTDKEYDFSTLNFLPVDSENGKITDALGNTLNRVVNVSASGATPVPEYIDLVATLDALKSDDALANAYANLTDPTSFYELMVIPMDVLKKGNYKVVGAIGNGCFSAFKTDTPTITEWASDAGTDFTDPDGQYTELLSQGYTPHHVSRENWRNLTVRDMLGSGVSVYTDRIIADANAAYNYNSRLLYGGISQRVNPQISASQIIGESRNPNFRGGELFGVYANIGGKYLTIQNSEDFQRGFRGEIPVIIASDMFSGVALEAKDGWSSSITFNRSSTLGGYKIWTKLKSSHLREKEDISGLYMESKSISEEWYKNDATTSSEKKLNAIATTKVDNPWLIEKMMELACSEIYALSSATEAISEGQFGQFPVYAFTDNGIYALSIDGEGNIDAKQAIAREVLSHSKGVLQLDNALVFPTKAGLKFLSKPPVKLISGAITGLNVNEGDFSPSEELTVIDTVPFEEQIQDARMVYDYAHQMIHIFGGSVSEGKQKHYVYDIESGQWATQILDKPLTTCVAGYPFSTMQFGKQLMQYTDALEVNVVKQGWLLTRPISFSDPFTRKMLADIRVLGQKTNTDTKFKVQVYISEDRVKWHRLTSLKGRSAKWYRFLIMADMCGLDTLTGITCQYVPRLGSKLR